MFYGMFAMSADTRTHRFQYTPLPPHRIPLYFFPTTRRRGGGGGGGINCFVLFFKSGRVAKMANIYNNVVNGQSSLHGHFLKYLEQRPFCLLLLNKWNNGEEM